MNTEADVAENAESDPVDHSDLEGTRRIVVIAGGGTGMRHVIHALLDAMSDRDGFHDLDAALRRERPEVEVLERLPPLKHRGDFFIEPFIDVRPDRPAWRSPYGPAPRGKRKR